jgi:hypothetical protein
MKTPDKGLSSKGRAKAEGKDAPTSETPMARFRRVAKRAFSADLEKVRELERREKARKRKPT